MCAGRAGRRGHKKVGFAISPSELGGAPKSVRVDDELPWALACMGRGGDAMTLQVIIPDGLLPGEPFCIAHGAEEFTILVPDGMRGGELLDVDLPASSAPEAVTVIVPAGCYAGDEFTVDFDGQSFNICVPDGCGPGVEISVEVPQPPQQRGPAELVGRRAELCGLIARGLLNGRKGTVRGYDAAKDLLYLAVDGMCPDLAVRYENVRELPEDDVPDPDNDEPPEAPPAGSHYVGDRVMVERSNGSVSYAIIVEYDEVLECYTVDVGCCRLKYGVEESYIMPHETSDVWAGPLQKVNGRFEGFFVGRRVRVPAMLNSSDDDDKNGVVTGYDKSTGFYHVELDSGVIRRTLLFKQIKVMYPLREDDIYS